jgi:hypothetical protein
MEWAQPSAYFYFRAGPHVDPDDGPDYVPVTAPLTSERRRRIKECRKKVNRIVTELTQLLTSGAEIGIVQSTILQRQKYRVVGLAASWDEAGQILTYMFRDEYLLPGSLENVCEILVAGPRILYGWNEQVSCAGGVTNRYTLAEMERLNRR